MRKQYRFLNLAFKHGEGKREEEKMNLLEALKIGACAWYYLIRSGSAREECYSKSYTNIVLMQ